MNRPDESGPGWPAIEVQVLKSASASLGRLELPDKAALLDEAGRVGGRALVAGVLTGLRHKLTPLAEQIRQALPSRAEGPNAQEASLEQAVGLRIKEAPEAREIKKAGGALKKLMGQSIGQASLGAVKGPVKRPNDRSLFF
ncbi:MAG: hypothetical protein LBT47_00485 [Deltaproteobacteria bacterium]|nr:hypothetical protein [Deltaproteobacteria bacterium]